MKIGFIGLGNIGLPAAKALVRAGHFLTAYDIKSERIEMLLELGASRGKNPREVASKSDVVFTSLPHPKVSEEVAFGRDGVLVGANPGMVFVEMSTTSPTFIKKLGIEAGAKGVKVLDAGVTKGTVYQGETRTWLLVGGDKDVLSGVKALLAVVAENVVHVGKLGAGMALKLVNQLMSLANLVTACEGMALGVKAGISPSMLLDIIGENSGDSYQLRNRGRKILKRGDFNWGGLTLDLASKDCELVKELARDETLPVYMLNMAHMIYEHARAKGLGNKDRAAVICLFEELIGKEIVE